MTTDRNPLITRSEIRESGIVKGQNPILKQPGLWICLSFLLWIFISLILLADMTFDVLNNSIEYIYNSWLVISAAVFGITPLVVSVVVFFTCRCRSDRGANHQTMIKIYLLISALLFLVTMIVTGLYKTHAGIMSSY